MEILDEIDDLNEACYHNEDFFMIISGVIKC